MYGNHFMELNIGITLAMEVGATGRLALF